MIMSITGPRETHDYRDYNLLGAGFITNHPPPPSCPRHRMAVLGGERPYVHANIARHATALVLPRDKIQQLAETLCEI